MREAGYVFLFGQAGVPSQQGLALALAFDMTLLLAGLIGAILYIIEGVRGMRS